MRWETEQLIWKWSVTVVSLLFLWWFRPWAGPRGQGPEGWLFFALTALLCGGLIREVFRRRPGR
jgi:hypothetical protein